MREIKFDILVRHKATGNTWRQVLTLDELLNRNGCLYNPGIQEIVFKREYTGKKDRDGKEVYEGDIIEFDKYEWGGDDNIHVVEWDEINSEWSFGGGIASDMHFRKVIGNIYENPLLVP